MEQNSRAQLLPAIHTLYHHPDNSCKEQAEKWLETWQQCSEAWQISDAVLHDANSQFEERFFCAQTLRTKVQKDLEELDESSVSSLRDSLLVLVLKHARSEAAVRTQLCLALASVAAFVPGAAWDGGGVVAWLQSRFADVPRDVALPCLLELLTVLPEEAGHTRAAVRPERRRQMIEELQQQAGVALQLLSSCLGQPGDRVQEQVLHAFAAWLRLSGQLDCGDNGDAVVNHPLVRAALAGLDNAATFDAAVDAIAELVWCTIDDASGSLRPGAQPLVQAILPHVATLRSRFAVASQRAAAAGGGTDAVAAGFEGHDWDDDEDVAKGMARLIVETAEAYVAYIAAGTPEVQHLVDPVLEVAAHPSVEVFSMCFRFWSLLSDDLCRNMSGPESATAFLPAFEQLIRCVQGRVRYPQDYETMRNDEKTEFRRSRYAIGETLLDAAKVLGPDRTVELVLAPLSQVSSTLAAGGAFEWRAAEASLFCLQASHFKQQEPAPNHPLLISLFKSLHSMPAEHALLHAASCRTIGDFAAWMSRALQCGALSRDDLNQLLQLLVSGLNSSATAPAASFALAQLCEACCAWMLPCVPNLMAIFNASLHCGRVAPHAASSSSSAAANVPLLSETDVNHILEATCAAVHGMPQHERAATLKSLFAPVLESLRALLQSHAAAADDRTLQLIITHMDRLSTLFSQVQDPGTAVQLLTEVWDYFNAAMDRAGVDFMAIESICRVPRHALKTAGKHAAPLLPTLVNSIPQRFEATQHSAFLYLASQLIKTFGADASQHAVLASMLQRMLAAACGRLRSLAECEKQPALVDDTFLLACRAVAYAPVLVIQPAVLPMLLDTALQGILVQHADACRSVLQFWCTLLRPITASRCGSAAPQCMAVLQAHIAQRGSVLVSLLLAGAVGALPIARVPDICSVLFSYLQFARQPGLQVLNETLARLPDKAAAAMDKQMFAGNAAATASASCPNDEQHERELDHALQSLADVCRRNRHSRRAAQQALLPLEFQQTFLIA